jgi:Cache domain
VTAVVPRDAGRIATAVSAVVEGVFATVAEIHAAAVGVLAAERQAGEGAARAALEERARQLLTAPGGLAIGMGLIVAPRPANDFRRRLLWWQLDGGRLLVLDPDLRPTSLGFYDYTATDWFDVPRRTGRRHVMGPYVDVHGTGRYLLTLTAPVVTGGEFVGVVGADVPVSRFESHLLHALGAVDRPFLLVDDEGRVALSTSPRWLVGALIGPAGGPDGPGIAIAGSPWRLHLTGPDGGPEPL